MESSIMNGCDICASMLNKYGCFALDGGLFSNTSMTPCATNMSPQPLDGYTRTLVCLQTIVDLPIP
eukprot:scaffold12266_cov27-Tisochrysis_lutea.AAC.2